MMDDSMSSDFLTYYIWSHIGAYSAFVKIYKSSLIRKIIIIHEIHAKLMIHSYFMMIP